MCEVFITKYNDRLLTKSYQLYMTMIKKSKKTIIKMRGDIIGY